MHEYAYPPNEINAEIPKLSRNTSYQSLSLVCLQTNLINNKSKENVKKVERQEINSNLQLMK